MKTPKMDPDEMLKAMAEEAVKQHKHIRTAIRDLTIQALQMREVSLKQVNTVVRKVTEGVNLGVNQERLDVEKTLSDAFAGMDEALLKVVEANKVALGRLTDSGASFEESIVKKGLTATGARAAETLETCARAARASMSPSREANLKLMHSFAQNYATLVSGVLIGLSEALEHGKSKSSG
jgi:hypothetical protein